MKIEAIKMNDILNYQKINVTTNFPVISFDQCALPRYFRRFTDLKHQKMCTSKINDLFFSGAAQRV